MIQKPHDPRHCRGLGQSVRPKSKAGAALLAAALTLGWTGTPRLAAAEVHFTTVGTYEATEFAASVRLAGTTAYLTDGSAGVQILDVSDPTAPTRIGNFDSPGSAVELQLAGNRAYLADGDQGMAILDLTNPTAPTVVGSYNPGVLCLDVKVVGNRAYVACGEAGLHIVDITDPASPAKLGEYLPTSAELFPWANKLQVVGNVVYLATGFFVAVDVSDPANPVELSRWEQNVVTDCQVSGNRLYLATADDGLVVFDVSQPTDPAEVARLGGGGYVRGVAGQGSVVFVPDYWRGILTAFDLSDPKSPIELGKVACGGYPRRVEIRDQVAFVVAEGAGLVAVDVGDPTRMTVLGKVDTGGYARDIQFDGALLHVADQRVGFRTYRLDRIGFHNDVRSSMAATTTFGVPVPLAGVSDNGLPVRFVVTGGPGRIEGDRLVPTGIGRIELRASTEPTAEYLAAERRLVVVSALPDVGVRRSGAAFQSAWTAGLPQARLQSSTAIGGDAGWQDVAAVATEADGQVQVPVQPTAAQEYFRLWHPYPRVPEPLSLKGWNRDVVLENQAAPKAEMISMFSGTWFESGLGGFDVGLRWVRDLRLFALLAGAVASEVVASRHWPRLRMRIGTGWRRPRRIEKGLEGATRTLPLRLMRGQGRDVPAALTRPWRCR